ncbi:ABC transporter permease [Brochothrix thermosphacta]|uniref:ABC transporter permease n=1 Tax=Brochothrix thermosphacta TaxID=2756 RepID=UPI00083F99EE|nr:ABC transporter permease [Brochothrix thermosphacta]ODJ59918.1 sugar ABC transporter permease [Brochothrix thermosphacta]
MDTLSLIVSSTLLMSAPLIFTALGGLLSERAGVVNIGLEGLMIMGAFSGIVFNLTFADTFGAWTTLLATLFAMVCSGVFALFHAVATITFRADHIISGTALNFLALGLTVFLTKIIYGKGQTDTISQNVAYSNIPILQDIPFIGQIFFQRISFYSYIAIIVAIVIWFVLNKTVFGLRLRSVGEHPLAADTMGIKVNRMRYIAVIMSGMLGGIGGALYAQSFTNNFNATTIAGQGFMALAALIFGKWNPLGALGAGLFFGFAQSLAVIGGSLPFFSHWPTIIMQILPYVLTILALAGLIGKAEGPKANGVNYVKPK